MRPGDVGQLGMARTRSGAAITTPRKRRVTPREYRAAFAARVRHARTSSLPAARNGAATWDHPRYLHQVGRPRCLAQATQPDCAVLSRLPCVRGMASDRHRPAPVTLRFLPRQKAGPGKTVAWLPVTPRCIRTKRTRYTNKSCRCLTSSLTGALAGNCNTAHASGIPRQSMAPGERQAS